MKRTRRYRSIAAAIFACVPIQSAIASVTWTGASGTDWANGHNWSNNAGPSPTDTAIFTDTGSSIIPGDTTSVLNIDRIIGGLVFSDTAGHYHTLDLAGHGLDVAGSLSFNLDQGSSTTTTVRNGALLMTNAFGQLNVGRAVSGSASAIVDLSGLRSIAAHVQDVLIGTSTANGANGTLTLSPLNNISANTFVVGSNGNGNLTLGQSNTILTPQFTIAKDFSNSAVKIVSGGNLMLGSLTQRTNLSIANQNIGTNDGYGGTLDLTGGTFNAFLGDLIVGQRQTGGFGGTLGTLIAGTGGSVDIGAPGNTANVIIGHMLTGNTNATGSVDFSGLQSLNANLNSLLLGTAISGSANGTLKLAANNNIGANSIVIGSDGDATLTLGHANTILTPQLTIAQDFSNSSVKIVSGGNLTLGSPTQRTDLSIADQNIGTNDGHGGTLDLTGGSFNSYLGNLTVGQRQTGGFGGTVASLIGGSGGSVDIGAAGNTANVTIGHTLNGGSSAAGTVDFSGLSSLTAHLNTLSIGMSEAGSAQGTLKLAANSFISANSIIIGSNAGGTLALGHTNTILTPQLVLGRDISGASMTIPVGGSLTLGSPSQPVSLSIATGSVNANATVGGTLDLTGATLNAYLDSVVIGNEVPSPGTELGTMTISSRPDNSVHANSILIGGGASTGVLNFGGGMLTANTITAGSGNATFNWTGGRLGVGTFGTQAINFDLNNTGTGTLAPGSASAFGATTIFGNYSQGSAATMALDVSGAGSDGVRVSGTAALAGTLSLNSLTGGILPTVGQVLPLATYASHTGSFGFVVPPILSPDVAFVLDYGSTQLSLRFVAPAAQTWTGSSGPLSTPGNWSNNTTPGTSSSLSITNSTATPETVSVTSSTTVHSITLAGTSAPVSLDVPQGIQLGVANQINVGANATLNSAGQTYGMITVASGGTMHLTGATVNGLVFLLPNGTLQLSGTQPNQLLQGVFSAGQVNVDPGSIANFAQGLGGSRGSLNIGAAARVQFAPGSGRSHIESLTIAPGGSLDLADNPLVIQYVPNPDPSATINGYLASGYNHGAWNGTGIIDSAADANHGLGFAHFAPDDLMIAPALYGDANLDGSVNFTDLLALAQHYGQTNATWEQGDFNYDGTVGFDDLLQLAQHYGQSLTATQLASLSPTFRADVERAFAAVPEPASLMWLAPIVGLAARRRRASRGATSL
jgi:hypothetical protein